MESSKITAELDQISSKMVGVSLSVIVIVVGLFLSVAMGANLSRRSQVVKSFTQETDQLVKSREYLFQELFEQTFTNCQTEVDQEQARQRVGEVVYAVMCETAQRQLSRIGVEAWRDSSAVAYLRVIDQDKYQLLEASGNFHGSLSLTGMNGYGVIRNEPELIFDLSAYFAGKKSINLWRDFNYQIPGKEVMVPVKANDQVIGYILRGVIE